MEKTVEKLLDCYPVLLERTERHLISKTTSVERLSIVKCYVVKTPEKNNPPAELFIQLIFQYKSLLNSNKESVHMSEIITRLSVSRSLKY